MTEIRSKLIQILMSELKEEDRDDLETKKFKELLDMYNELYNKQYYYEQLKPKVGAFKWD